ncbi:uncharacterized protein ASPGLDRAFT_763992 [Aspergillus glaucus CBS 516.65]|uniref:Uncharacterized protein n=1 Tax=Aspergillus glaucus CBS 516.65 TaxID=1160497 RepID=A0A1L9VAW5_ASPGL|nr:hypothetical protein ASPGLDRAFT_763992 [Aspergillus glaucus CBS 516.65]OJJ81050.1 hypothetical protein ASPGLDRAFT_763992 [Aspergillus glaucus CBS 516.65]
MCDKFLPSFLFRDTHPPPSNTFLLSLHLQPILSWVPVIHFLLLMCGVHVLNLHCISSTPLFIGAVRSVWRLNSGLLPDRLDCHLPATCDPLK